MKNEQHWKESKFRFKGETLIATTDSTQLAPQSWLVANCVARCYQKAFPLYCRGQLLDLGCGKVPFYAAYRRYINESICVDWANSPHSNIHVDLECDLNAPIPLDGDSFDIILISDVLEHIYNPHHLMSECLRLLKPRGHVLMNVPFFYWIHEAPFDFYRFTEFSLLRMAEETGFGVRAMQPVGGGLEVLADLVAKLSAFVPLLGRPVGWSIQRAVWHFSRTQLGGKVLAKSARNFTLGYFCVFEKVQ